MQKSRDAPDGVCSARPERIQVVSYLPPRLDGVGVPAWCWIPRKVSLYSKADKVLTLHFQPRHNLKAFVLSSRDWIQRANYTNDEL